MTGQFVLFYLWNTYREFKQRMLNEREQTKRIEAYSQQGVTVECAHCRQPNYIPIRLDDVNEFNCEVCGKPNSVYVDITVAQQAALLDKQNLSITSLLEKNINEKSEQK